MLAKIKFLRLKIMCLWVSSKKKYEKNFFAALQSLRKKSDPGLDPDLFVRGADPDPHQNVTDPQHFRDSIQSAVWAGTRYGRVHVL
jgi:hypothetical protein